MSTPDNQFVGYFGYGSLVNPDTLRTDYVQTISATLLGWQRHWQGRSEAAKTIGGEGQDLCLLSVHRKKGSSIRGALVIDHIDNLPQVDEREAGYCRVQLAKEDLELEGDQKLPDIIFVYVAEEPELSDGSEKLLQSYLDAVMQGFFKLYGMEGVVHFVQTTLHFEKPMIMDRLSPIYPRSVALSDQEIALFDHALDKAGVQRQ